MIGWSGRQILAAAPLVALLLTGTPVLAADTDYLDHTPPLLDRLTPEVLAAVFPGAGRLELVKGDGPPMVAVYKGDAVAGYIFSTLDVVDARGYRGTPFDVVAGVDVGGTITGAVTLFQQEPHIQNDRRRTELLEQYMLKFPGMKVAAGSGPPPDFIAGATVSARAMRSAIRSAARMVLNPALWSGRPQADARRGQFEPRSTDELLADGAINSIAVTNADLAAALQKAGVGDLRPEVAPRGGPADTYIQLRVGLATPAMIGRNGTDEPTHERLFSGFPAGSEGILLASSGHYDFQGIKFQNKSSGYALDRFRIVQGDHSFEFDRTKYFRARSPLGSVAGIAVLPPETGFDPLKPWRVELLVHAAAADGRTATVALPALDYRLPDKYIVVPEPPPVPAWVEAWQEGRTNVFILSAALVVLTLILAFQSVLTRSRRAHRWVRTGFLLFTLVWLGWTVGGQLSIIHVIDYLQAPFEGLDLGFYLAEPLIVIISLYALLSVILIGRGVFCGWLCPFGALQELLAQLARLLRLPQWTPSDRLQGYLWIGKYASVAVIVALAFLAPTAASWAEEAEPFKTAITAVFAREFPYVLYAVGLLSVGLFTERAYCRFLCPLGGALAILDRLHLINLLKRRPECGNPCHLCERACPVGAIVASGQIKTAECFQCLDCQVEYHDEQRCPPLVKARKQRQRRPANPRPAVVHVPVTVRTAT